MADQLPTATQAFGAKPVPTATQAFGAPPVNTNEVALGGADMDDYFSQGSPGRILDVLGQGFKSGWGSSPLGMDPEVEADLKQAGILNDYQNNRTSLAKSFNEALIRPSAIAIDAAARAAKGIMGAAGAGLGEVEKIPGPLGAAAGTAQALMEAFPAGHLTGMPVAIPPELSRAADLKTVGAGEAGYQGLPEATQALAPTGRESATERVVQPQAAPVETPAAEAAPEAAETPAPQPPADIHEAARQIAPDTFAEYDALSARKDTFRQWIDEIRDNQVNGILDKVNGVESRLTNAAARRLAEARSVDTPEMAKIRQDLQATDVQMRDLAPDVSAAYRQAAEQFPETQAEPAAQPVEPPVSETTPEAAPEATAPQATPAAAEAPVPTEQPAAATPAAEQPAPVAPETAPATPATPSTPLEGGIAGDVTKQLVAAGRPAEEANAAGALVQAHYEARAARFEGAKGSAEDLYSTEAPTVKAGRGVQPALELAQDRSLQQTRRGSIRLATDQAGATIKLFKDADASTFVHETGHAWLEEMMRDAADARAPDDLKADAQTVHDWLGTKAGEEIPTKAHEKFARGFERYMMEGHAPSAKLADVFAKFRDWLTRIYETATKLRSPINDDIRGVFDRMLAMKDEKPVIAPEREPTSTFAEMHEADAANTLPPQAGEVAETVRSERDMIGEAAHPEIEDERLGARAPEGDAGSAEGSDVSGRGGAAPEPNAAPAGRVSEPRPVSPRGGQSARESNPAPVEPNASFGPTEGRLIDKAGNIRLDNLNQPEDIDQVIRDAADRNGDFGAERRGVITDGQLLDLADAVGKDPAFLDRKKIGDAFSPEEILAARKLLVQSASAVRDAMEKAAGGTDADVLALAKAISRHEMIQGKVAQATAEWGRAGRAFRELSGDAGVRDLNQLLKQSTGRDLNQLREMAQLGKTLKTPAQVSKFVADTAGGNIRRAIIFYYVNALISGPITHLRYSVGNVVNALWDPLIATPVQAVSGATREMLGMNVEDRVYLRESAAQLYGLSKGFRDALPAALEAWRTGNSPYLPGERIPSNFTGERQSPIPGPAGRVIGTPARGVAAIHSFFKAIRYEQEIQALAMRDALNKGLEGTERDLHVAKLTESPTPEMMEQATASALKALYMRPTDYNSMMAGIVRATNHPSNMGLLAKIILPFLKIGSEITRNAFIERTPLGLLTQDVRDNLFMRNGGAAFDQQMGKMIVGTGLMGVTALGVFEGMITGAGPNDPEQRRVWLLDHSPYHVTIGPVSFSYKGLGHLGMLMGFSANMTETAHGWGDGKGGEENGTKMAFAFLEGITRSVLDENFMRGLDGVLEAMYHPEEHFDSFAKNFVTNWLPFSVGLGQVARLVDPYQRETNSIFDAFRARIPFVSEGLYPRRDIFGEPITNGSGTVDRYANDKVMQAMDALHMGVGPVSRKIRGVQLTPQQYDDYSRISGRMAKMELDAMINPAFTRMPAGTQIKQIKDTIARWRETAAVSVMGQGFGGPNDIITQANQAKVDALIK